MSQTIKQQIGQMIIAGFKGLQINPKDPVVRDIQQFNIGGVILYDEEVSDPNERWRNIRSTEQTKSLIQNLKKVDESLLICIDQEGGNVQRLKEEYGFLACPSWNEIGSHNDEKVTRKFAASISNTLNELGINVNLAPVVDLEVNGDAYQSKESRCFSSDPSIIADHSQIFVEAHQNKNVICTLKHFPGLGSAQDDTHEGFTDISNTWSEREIEPFKQLIDQGKVDLIMVGHSFHREIDPGWPASMSEKTVNGLLRTELNYDGVVICDDPMMGAISNQYDFETAMGQIINASVDLLCFGNNLVYDRDIVPRTIETIFGLIDRGHIEESRIHESVERIQILKQKF